MSPLQVACVGGTGLWMEAMAVPGIGRVEIILYVADQTAASGFYGAVLESSPVLDVPGMTEFVLGGGVVLGLMPEAGIARIVSPPLPDPAAGTGVPRCELYLHAADVDAAYRRAVRVGAQEVSPPSRRDWGHYAGYLADRDGHVLAFASAL